MISLIKVTVYAQNKFDYKMKYICVYIYSKFMIHVILKHQGGVGFYASFSMKSFNSRFKGCLFLSLCQANCTDMPTLVCFGWAYFLSSLLINLWDVLCCSRSTINYYCK